MREQPDQILSDGKILDIKTGQELDSLNGLLRQYADARPWVMLTHRCVCTNCGSISTSAAKLMREEHKDHFVRATGAPPPGIQPRAQVADAHFMRCEKCAGERPLRVSIQTAIEGFGTDADLAQRVGHILADWFKRKRAMPQGVALEWED